jgi:ABC-2 type transport system ATP-binding protein
VSAIEIRDVTKRFGSTTAVNAVSFDVPDGSIYGFIGPNGSGKTTTIRMIMNILVPDGGDIVVLGSRDRSESRDAIGYLPEERGLYKKMTVRQVLRYYGQLKGAAVSDIDRVLESWLDRFQLAEWADKRVQTLSKGMSQKVQFLSAMVSNPKLLILDEPFSGLDPVNADTLRDAVIDLRRAGTTVIFSTHDMSAAERLCDRIMMIFKGRKVLDGTLDEIQARYGQDTIRIQTAAGAGALTGLAHVESVIDAGNYQDVRLVPQADPQALLGALVARTRVQQFQIVKPSLHDIFVRIARPTAADLREPAAS